VSPGFLYVRDSIQQTETAESEQVGRLGADGADATCATSEFPLDHRTRDFLNFAGDEPIENKSVRRGRRKEGNTKHNKPHPRLRVRFGGQLESFFS
jgi:hypothetical protein